MWNLPPKSGDLATMYFSFQGRSIRASLNSQFIILFIVADCSGNLNLHKLYIEREWKIRLKYISISLEMPVKHNILNTDLFQQFIILFLVANCFGNLILHKLYITREWEIRLKYISISLETPVKHNILKTDLFQQFIILFLVANCSGNLMLHKLYIEREWEIRLKYISISLETSVKHNIQF